MNEINLSNITVTVSLDADEAIAKVKELNSLLEQTKELLNDLKL